MQKNARLKKIARHLLATTCLTAAVAGMASATTITETSDFSNVFAGANVLPIGTDVVHATVGFVNGVNDPADYFQLKGLFAGSAFSLQAMTSDALAGNMNIYSSSQSPIGSANGSANFFFTNQNASVSGIVPADGILVVGITDGEGSGAYTVNLLNTAPEPSTLVGAGLGLASVVALRRKRKV